MPYHFILMISWGAHRFICISNISFEKWCDSSFQVFNLFSNFSLFVFGLCILYVFVLNELVDTLPFTEYVSAVINDDSDPVARIGFFPRLCFPYFTPPFLAIMISIYTVLVFYSKKEIVNRLNCYIRPVLIFLLIGCLTRTVYLSLLLTVILGTCFHKFKKHLLFFLLNIFW